MKKRVCLVLHSLQVGGMERVMAGFANHLAQKKDLEVFLILLIKSEHFFLIDKRIIIIEPNFLYKKESRIFYLIRTLFWLRRQVKKIKPSTLLSFGEYWNSVILAGTIGLNVPKYISDRSKPTIAWKGFNEFVRKMTYPMASGFIAQTELASMVIKNRYHLRKTIVTGNPIRSLRLKDWNRENFIVNVGRLIEYKQQEKLIRIFSKLPNSEGWKLLIIGDGPLKPQIEATIKNLGLEEKVMLIGSQKNVDQYLIKSKIFAFTSNYEGFPNALAEGMMAGCACISFDCEAGPSDIIEDGVDGFLIPLDDEDLYVKKLQELINNSELMGKFQKAGIKKIQKYSAEVVNEKMLKFILS